MDFRAGLKVKLTSPASNPQMRDIKTGTKEEAGERERERERHSRDRDRDRERRETGHTSLVVTQRSDNTGLCMCGG